MVEGWEPGGNCEDGRSYMQKVQPRPGGTLGCTETWQVYIETYEQHLGHQSGVERLEEACRGMQHAGPSR